MGTCLWVVHPATVVTSYRVRARRLQLGHVVAGSPVGVVSAQRSCDRQVAAGVYPRGRPTERVRRFRLRLHER